MEIVVDCGRNADGEWVVCDEDGLVATGRALDTALDRAYPAYIAKYGNDHATVQAVGAAVSGERPCR